MKKKPVFFILYCALFFVLCLFFGLGAFFLGTDEGNEGREIASFPALMDEDGWNTRFFTEFDEWLSDHFALRQNLISVNSAVREHLFATGNDQVIVGGDNFLFYKETVPDYTGESLLSPEEIETIADALLALSDYASEHGSRFLFTVAPNKNTVYPDKMPAAYRRLHTDAPSNMDLLYAALEERGVPYVDLRDCLRDTDTLLYHRRDTHWNSAGALAAYCAVMEEIGMPYEDYSDCPLLQTTDFSADLEGMLYPGTTRLDENCAPDFDFSAAYAYTAGASDMDMTVQTVSNGTGSLIMFRDSFGSAWIPYFSTAFASVRYERATPYRIDLLARNPADLVIVEIAERNIPLLSSCADRILPES